jgi:hypothetical protein
VKDAADHPVPGQQNQFTACGAVAAGVSHSVDQTRESGGLDSALKGADPPGGGVGALGLAALLAVHR